MWRTGAGALLLAIVVFGAIASVGPARDVAAETNTGGRDEARALYANHPDWLLPAWAGGGPAVWTIVGAPYATNTTLVAPGASIAPHNHGPAVTFWLYDLDADRLLVPAEQDWRVRLDDDYLPIVSST